MKDVEWCIRSTATVKADEVQNEVKEDEITGVSNKELPAPAIAVVDESREEEATEACTT